MNKANIIEKQLKKTGSKTYLQDGDWQSAPFYACIYQLWRRSRSNFEISATAIGEVSSDYYMYIGPATHDITALSDNAIIVFGKDKFLFKKREAIKIEDEIIYYAAAVRRIWESEDDE